MRDFRDAKAMAQSLRQALAARSVTITHSDALELIAKSFGFDNWNILAARIDEAAPSSDLAPAEGAGKGDKVALCCSFCGKSQYEVAKLIAGPDSFICNECVELCNDVIDEGVITDLLRHSEGGEQRLEDYLRSRFPEQLVAYRPRLERWIARLDWSLGEVARALGEPVPYKPGGAPVIGKNSMADWPLDRLQAHRKDLVQRRDAAIKTREATDRIIGASAPG